MLTRTWTDVTADVRTLTYAQSGLNDYLQRPVPGSLSMILGNASGNYDPSYVSGAYYPGVKREAPIRVRALWNGSTYGRWSGFVDEWLPSWPNSGKDNIVHVTASDWLAVLNLIDIGGNHFAAGTTVAQAANAVVAGLGTTVEAAVFVPGTGISNAIDSGVLANGTTLMAYLGQLIDTENGRLTVGADGSISFFGRHDRALGVGATPKFTLGENAGEMPYRDASLASNNANIWNHAVITTQDGTAKTSDNASSQASFFQRGVLRTTLNNDYNDALSQAQWITSTFGNPSPKLPLVEVLPTQASGWSPTTLPWDDLLQLTNSNRVTFKRRPSYGGTISIDQYVEQVSETIAPGGPWQTFLMLLPCQDQHMWQLGDAVNGLLGQTTNVGY